MKTSSYNIALVGIFSALQIVFVYLSFVIDPVTISLQAIASVCLMIPMARGAKREGVLSYIAVSIVTTLLTGLPFCLYYILFSGLFTLATVLLRDVKLSKIVVILIKVVYVSILFYIFYEVFKGMIVIDFDKLGFEIGYPILAIMVAVFTVVYDYILQRVYDTILSYFAKSTSNGSSGRDDI